MMLAELLEMNVLSVLMILGAVSGIFLLLTLLVRAPGAATQWVLFLGISIPALLATLFLAFSTVSQNIASVTQGPVHWHADFILTDCGKDIDLKKPRGLVNRIGTPLFHEHGDKRIHVEGVVTRLSDVSLQRFFEVIGGGLTQESVAIPTEKEGLLVLASGQQCPNGAVGKLQVFVYSTKDGQATQRKLENFTDYVPSPETLVPPGDCVVVEFGPERAKTDRLCTTYRIAEQKGELTIK